MTKRMWMIVLGSAGVVAGSMLFGNSTWAQGVSNSLPEIVVTASPITQSESVGVDGGNVSLVGRAQIEDLDAKELPTALREVPGVTISRYNPVGSYGGDAGGSVYIRGEGAGRPGSEIKIFSDGAPREAGVWGHPIMDMVPVDFADSISIFKGPQPQSYPGTFGAVDIESLRRYQPGYESEVNFGYGSYDTILGSVTTGGKVDGFDYYLGDSHKQSDGFRPHGDAVLDDQFLRLGADISSQDHVSYVLQRTDNWSRDPGEIGTPTPVLNKFSTETMTHVLRLDDNHDCVQGFALFYYDNGQIRWAKDQVDSPAYAVPGYSDADWDNYGFRASYDVRIDKLTLTGALDLESEGGSAWNDILTNGPSILEPGSSFDGRFITTAPYVGARYALDVGGVTITPSIGDRYYFNSEFDSDNAPCAALTLDMKNGVQLFVSYARGVNYPGIYVMEIDSSATRDQLKAEVMDNTEAGVHCELSKTFALQVSVFHYKENNEIEFAPPTWQLVNVGEIKVNGAEVAFHLNPCDDLALFAGVTCLHSDPDDAPRMPDLSVSAGGSYKITRYVKLSLDGEYVSDQYAYNGRGGAPSTPDLVKVDSYLVANAKVAMDIAALSSLHGELYVSAENITDEKYEFLPGYPMPGTTYTVGMKLKF